MNYLTLLATNTTTDAISQARTNIQFGVSEIIPRLRKVSCYSYWIYIIVNIMFSELLFVLFLFFCLFFVHGELFVLCFFFWLFYTTFIDLLFLFPLWSVFFFSFIEWIKNCRLKITAVSKYTLKIVLSCLQRKYIFYFPLDVEFGITNVEYGE